MNNKKIGCSAGKTSLVDPNNFDGHDSSTNISVPIEDLNITVQLSTYKKGRTVLTTQSNGKGVGESSNTVRVTFIEGGEVNGNKVLTTKYTDLTTSLDENNVNESLGITNIDIDFNSSYAPMVTINFIDVRGSAIFQNEENIKNGENKYSTFFQLPYPLYELTVKGYYGRPVKYCLHMTKFNSKFNSQTGNFEITANYIGYTYAMLSDMLIGYLKAIPYTEIGRAKYQDINNERASLGLKPVLNLNDLMVKISNINKEIEKIASTDNDSNIINISESKLEILDSIESNIVMLGRSLDSEKKELDIYKYIVTTEINDKAGIDVYTTSITNNIDEFNSNFDLKLVVSEFIKLTDILYVKITLDTLNPETTLTLEEEVSLKVALKNPIDFDTKRADLYDALKNRGLSNSVVFNVYDLTSLYNKLNDIKSKVGKKIENSKVDLAKKLKNKVSENIGFDPTIRNIIEVFTTSVEVFLSTIYDVSEKAEKNEKRKTELDKKFSDLGNSDLVNKLNFYPWPDYRENAEKEGYVEKYLGSAGVLSDSAISDVDELEFIDELLKAFLTAQKVSEVAQISLANEEKNWIPINPIDTKLFVDKAPYKRINGINTDEILRLLLLRGMTYLGYTNSIDVLTTEDVINMANIESEAILANIPNDITKTALTQIKIENIINVTGTINAESIPVVKKYNTGGVDYYYYDYIFDSKSKTPNLTGFKVVPISNGFIGDWNPNLVNNGVDVSNDSQGLVQRSLSDVFLTNYSSALKDINDLPINKEYDGGVYVKIKTIHEYNSEVNDFVVDIDTTNVLILNILKQDNVGLDAGFKAFGGDYGIQEFINLDYGEPDLDGLPLRHVFYSDMLYNGFGLSRKITNKDTKKEEANSLYDLRFNNKDSITSVIVIPENITKLKDSIQLLHTNYGKNRAMFNSILKNNTTVTYPYVNQLIGSDVDNPKSLFSLFGSQWYYYQDIHSEYTKALLFLNTLPWNGLSFEPNEIRHLFDKKGGFIHAPRLWCAYIGGLIWRSDSEQPEYEFVGSSKIIGGGSGLVDPINWFIGTTITPSFSITSRPPNRDEYFTMLNFDENEYPKYHDLLISLPDQVKNEFKRVFLDFVNGDDGLTSWTSISSQLEIWGGDGNGFKNVMDEINVTVVKNNTGPANITSFTLANRFSLDNYVIATPINVPTITVDNGSYNNIFLELRGDYGSNVAVRVLVDSLNEELIITNTGYAIWLNDNSLTTRYTDISVRKEFFDLYFNTVVKNFNDRATAFSTSNIKKEQEQEIFGTSNENVIKLQLYRTCKNIYDKWIGGAKSSDNIMFQCGDSFGLPLKNGLDTEIAKKVRGDGAKSRLIDSFRFVTRSFRDIGDEFFINPTPVNEYLSNNPNSSFYDVVTSLLSANNFDFIALPSYINYNDPKILESIFDTIQYDDVLENGVCGPSFVCVYVGQKSKHLDFAGSEYTNDGFDFGCDKNGNMNATLPKDFTIAPSEHENNVAVFSVNFSQQNQNIFKDIILDQSEFSETAESLQIIDDISNKGSENNRTLAGQNIYNVYSVRSYKAEVEMLGNAMIQPMMYFQLNNIPMFHGAYMITHVRHSIKPNYMSTHFTGVRIRHPETRLLDATDLYMSILDSIDTSASSTQTANSGIFGTFEQNILPDPSINNLFLNPFRNKVSIVSAPGIRSLDGRVRTHEGVDFATPYGSVLQSIYDGTIELIKYNKGGYGLYMVINHGVLGNEKLVYKSVYGHFSDIDKSIVDLSTIDINKILDGYNPNIKVKKGQVIGKSGGTKGKKYLDNINSKYDLAGHSTGAHLHYELRIGEENQINTDFKLIKFVNAVPYLPIGLDPEYVKFIPKPIVVGEVSRIPTPSKSQALTQLGKI